MRGFRSPGMDLAFEWDEPFGAVRDRVRKAEARDVEEIGVRMLRFEESFRRGKTGIPMDLQYEMDFSPDHAYGLRRATARIEQVAHSPAIHLEQGTYAGLVQAYLELYEHLAEAYGAPMAITGFEPGKADRLIYLLDHTRESTVASALWATEDTRISHDLNISFTPQHVLRWVPIVWRLRLINGTGKAGLVVALDFPRGPLEVAMERGGVRTVEFLPGTTVKIRVSLGGKVAETEWRSSGEDTLLEVRRQWWNGTLSIHNVTRDR